MTQALQDDALEKTISENNPSFLFIDSLVEKPTGATLVVLLIVYVATQMGSTLVSLTPATDDTQRKIMLALPFIFVPFIISFPAGLILYWITTNFWTLGQSFVVKWLRIRQGDPVLTGAGDGTVSSASGAAAVEQSTKAPPPPPRQKKKKTGRRR